MERAPSIYYIPLLFCLFLFRSFYMDDRGRHRGIHLALRKGWNNIVGLSWDLKKNGRSLDSVHDY